MKVHLKWQHSAESLEKHLHAINTWQQKDGWHNNEDAGNYSSYAGWQWWETDDWWNCCWHRSEKDKRVIPIVTLISVVWQVWWAQANVNKNTLTRQKTYASSITVWLLGSKIKVVVAHSVKLLEDRGNFQNEVTDKKTEQGQVEGIKKEQLRKEMRKVKNSQEILFLSWGFLGWTKESQALEREEEGGSNAWQDLLFTPFFPLRSFLYCSLSLVIRPGSTSQASEMGPCSSFSTQGEQDQTERLLRKCPGWSPGGLRPVLPSKFITRMSLPSLVLLSHNHNHTEANLTKVIIHQVSPTV